MPGVWNSQGLHLLFLECLQFFPHYCLVCGWMIIEVTLTKLARLLRSGCPSLSLNPAQTGLSKMSLLTLNQKVYRWYASGMAGSRAPCIYQDLFPSTSWLCFPPGQPHCMRQVQVQRDLIFPHISDLVAVVRGCNVPSAPGLNRRAHPWSWGWGPLYLNYISWELGWYLLSNSEYCYQKRHKWMLSRTLSKHISWSLGSTREFIFVRGRRN